MHPSLVRSNIRWRPTWAAAGSMATTISPEITSVLMPSSMSPMVAPDLSSRWNDLGNAWRSRLVSSEDYCLVGSAPFGNLPDLPRQTHSYRHDIGSPNPLGLLRVPQRALFRLRGTRVARSWASSRRLIFHRSTRTASITLAGLNSQLHLCFLAGDKGF